MNQYAPPKAPINAGVTKVSHVAKGGLSFFAGMLSYYVFHWLSGVLGDWVWPPFLNSISRLCKPVTIPAADLVALGTPMVLSYLVIAFLWFTVVRSSARSTLLAFAVGWLVPTLFVIVYGEHKEPGAFLELWAKWPHAAILHFCSLIGVWLGFRLSRRQSRRSAGAA
jgi:hypothetical protein